MHHLPSGDDNWSTGLIFARSMALKILFCLSALAVVARGGIVAAPLPYVAPFASSVAAHVTHHSVAAPYVAAPVAAAPLVSAPIAAPVAAPIAAPVAAPVVPAARIAAPVFGHSSLIL